MAETLPMLETATSRTDTRTSRAETTLLIEVIAAELTDVTADTEAVLMVRAETSAWTEVMAVVLAAAIAETWAIWVPRAETTGMMETTAKAAIVETVV